ncbi:MAG: GSCFA domain-containing protein [Pseudomonadota bacterium]
MTHPYADIADYRHWRRAPGAAVPAQLDPVARTKFSISREEPVATAGSCFAQHVMRHLDRNGFNTLIAEAPPTFFGNKLATQFGYGIFSTRSGNVYTARQLVQLFQRAEGSFVPEAEPWDTPEGLLDPFRPSVGAFSSLAELEAERAYHLDRVGEMLRGLSVFVFTLGLTEAWLDRDGAAFPIAPGTAGGTFDPARHSFVNFSVDEVVADLRAALELLRAVNPNAKIILTVSPVPLMATALDRHVLVSTVYSKSVLRVAAETVAGADSAVDYFPSYEIITAPHVRGRYFGPDARAVTEDGVRHVMRVFLKHYGGADQVTPAKRSAPPSQSQENAAIAEAICDEELLGAR